MLNTQTCPCCGGNLEKGTLRHRGSGYFLPEGEKLPSLYTSSELNRRSAIPLPPSPYTLGKDPCVAYVCRSCRFLLIPYEE